MSTIAPRAWCSRSPRHRNCWTKNRWLQRSIKVRNPYVDPINYIQVALLQRLRTESEPEVAQRLRAALLLSVNGIAAGLQNAG